MPITRTLAHPLMAGIFVYGGVDTLRNARAKAPLVEDVAQPLADAIPVDLPSDTEQLVKLNGAVQVAAGVLLATGQVPPHRRARRSPRPSSPTTVAAHRFWEAEDDAHEGPADRPLPQERVDPRRPRPRRARHRGPALPRAGAPSAPAAKRCEHAGEIVSHTTDRVVALVPGH